MSLRLPKGLFEKNGKIYVLFYDPSAKRTRGVSSGFPARQEYIKDAKAFREHKLKEAKNRNGLRSLTNYRLSVLLDNFFEAKEDVIAESTKEIYKRAVNELFTILEDKPIMDYTEDDFEFFFRKLKNDRGLTDTTRAMYSRHLKAIFEYYTKKRVISYNPVPRLESPKKAIITIPKVEVEQMLARLKQKQNIYGYDLVKFLYLAGFRISEALSLSWKNINLQKGIIHLENGKAKRKEVFPINKYLLTHLTEMSTRKFSEDQVFIYQHPSCAFFYRTQKELWGEVRYSFHNLRKSFITALAWASGNPLVVQSGARHSNAQTTQDYYIEVKTMRIKEEIDRLDINEFELSV